MPNRNAQLIKTLQGYSFSKYIVFPAVPILYFESGASSYVDNQNYKKLNINRYPVGVTLLVKTYEAWRDNSYRIVIRDPRIIEKIIEKNLQFVRRRRPYLQRFLKRKQKLGRKELIDALKKLNAIGRGTYEHFTFFTDECFETTDDSLLSRLPKVRLEVSNFILKEFWKAIDKFMDMLAEECNLPKKAIHWMTTREIFELLRNQQNGQDFKEVINRPVGYFIGNNRIRVFFGKDVIGIARYLKDHDTTAQELKRIAGTKKFRGNIAFRGVARGRVVKLLEKDYDRYDTILKSKRDFILVTPMTRPEIVPYLKYAKGIITDEGGITCHAAIVARELKKPCIIGMKIATQVLKDGDLVEVDANKGIVTILK